VDVDDDADSGSHSQARLPISTTRHNNDLRYDDPSMDICRSLISDQDRSAIILSYILDDAKSQALFPLRSHGDFYKFIACRLGRNQALDTSISCLCAIYMETLSNSSAASRDSIQLYAKSLNSLRTCLENEHVRTESETICASIILQLCEVRLQPELYLQTFCVQKYILMIL